MTQGAVKTTGKRSRAVSAKKKAILSAALDTFSQFGFHGTRLEQIAELAGVSKTNLLYYFPSKEALYIAVLRQILDIWLAPLKAFREDFAPLAAIKEYIRLKLEEELFVCHLYSHIVAISLDCLDGYSLCVLLHIHFSILFFFYLEFGVRNFISLCDLTAL